MKYSKVITLGLIISGSFIVEPYTLLAHTQPESEIGLSWFKKKRKKDTDKKSIEAANDSTKGEKKYEDITGKESLAQQGLLTIYKKKNDYYFEIPDSILGRDLLVVNKLQKVPYELNEAGVNKGINYENKLIRFELDKEEKKLKVRQIRPLPGVPSQDAISRSVQDNFISPLIAGFKIEAFNKDSTSCIIKINDIYNGTETSINNVFQNINLGTSPIKNLSKIVSAKSFPNNVVVTSELTTKVTEGSSSVNITVEVSSSVVLLPKKPMTGRLENPRVGYFTTPRMYFSDKQQKMENQELLTRWRLEPKEEDIESYLQGNLVEPKKPIVFYIDNSTPPQWKKYIKQGVEDWQSAFEKAGFKNAIQAIELPDSISPDVDDINYSVITYVASPKANAMGPSICDPRSGEIIEADIIWWHNVMSMLQKWITVQTGTINPAARQITLPDSLMGDAMRFVACHEVGHSLGLRHNMMGSAAFPTDSLRSKAFTDRMNSTSSSIMDYARYNYVAQPGDQVTKVAPHIGDYDRFAIEYGYRWSGKDEPEEENDLLFDLLSKHTGSLYKYSESQDPRDAIDPRAQNEDLGDDPVASSKYGIANLKRVMPEIINWTTTGEKGQSYFEASRLYYAVINQWNNYLYHVLSNIGGIYLETTTVGDGVHSYNFVPREKQAASVQFLLKEVLSYPDWLFNSSLNKYTFPMTSTPMGYQENAPSLILKNAQAYILWDLLENKRLVRMLENEAQNKKNAFTAVELLDGLHKHIFGKTEQGGILDLETRSLQKNFVDALILSVSEESTNKTSKKLLGENLIMNHSEPACSHDACQRMLESRSAARRYVNFSSIQANRISDAISVKRGELLRIRDLLQSRQTISDTATRYHYKDILLRINTALGLK